MTVTDCYWAANVGRFSSVPMKSRRGYIMPHSQRLSCTQFAYQQNEFGMNCRGGKWMRPPELCRWVSHSFDIIRWLFLSSYFSGHVKVCHVNRQWTCLYTGSVQVIFRRPWNSSVNKQKRDWRYLYIILSWKSREARSRVSKEARKVTVSSSDVTRIHRG